MTGLYIPAIDKQLLQPMRQRLSALNCASGGESWELYKLMCSYTSLAKAFRRHSQRTNDLTNMTHASDGMTKEYEIYDVYVTDFIALDIRQLKESSHIVARRHFQVRCFFQLNPCPKIQLRVRKFNVSRLYALDFRALIKTMNCDVT